jgi:hypothetical protein
VVVERGLGGSGDALFEPLVAVGRHRRVN